MSERAVYEKARESRAARWTRRLGLAASGAVLGTGVASQLYLHSDSETIIGGQQVRITPTLDEHTTLYIGILPDVRAPVQLPLGQGVSIDVGNSAMQATPLNSRETSEQVVSKEASERIVATLGAIAEQPEAEIAAIKDVMYKQAALSGGIGLGLSLVPASVSVLVGPRRRRELSEMLSEQDAQYNYLRIGAAAVLLATSIGVLNGTSEASSDVRAAPFVPLSKVAPYSSSIPELQNVEIRDIDLTALGSDIIKGVITSYDQSQKFYEKVLANIDQIKDQIHTPEDGQTVAIVYSDRHDNIGSDVVLKDLIKLTGATESIGIGDDTSSGAPWEVFSLRSIDRALSGIDERATIVGNHDRTDRQFVKRFLKSKHFLTASGQVQTLGDSSVLLVDDYRSSGLTPERATDGTTEAEVQEKIADIACEYGRVNILVTAKESLATDTLERGCVDLAISADTHVQTEPRLVSGGADESKVGYTVTNGTSGGAAFAFAAGSKYRREAAFTFVTFENGIPVGEQHLTISTTGVPEASEYVTLLPSSIYVSTPDQEQNDTNGVTSTGSSKKLGAVS